MADTEDWKDKMLRECAEADALEAGQLADGEKPVEPEGDVPKEAKEAKADETGQEAVSLSDLTRLAGDSGSEEPAEPTTLPKTAGAAGGDTELAERVKELEAQLQRERSENGRARALADELKRVKAERDEMANKVSEYEKRDNPVFQGDVTQFSEAEIENMSPEFRDMISSRFGALQARQAQLEREIERSQHYVRENEQASLQKAIQGEFPGLGNALTSDAWRKWCGEVDPVTQKRNGDLFLQANDACNRAAVSSLIRRFSFESGVDVSRRLVPGGKPGEVSLGVDNGAAPSGEKRYRADEVISFMNAVTSGRLSLSDKAVAARYREYNAALEDGRVDE